MSHDQQDVTDGARELVVRVRSSAEPVPHDRGRRRWPWALGAALLGATAGAVVAVVLRRVVPSDAPDAQEPEDVEAVVDLQRPATPTSTVTVPPPGSLGGGPLGP